MNTECTETLMYPRGAAFHVETSPIGLRVLASRILMQILASQGLRDHSTNRKEETDVLKRTAESSINVFYLQ